MTAPDPDEEPSLLRRLIREGGSVRPLGDHEREALFARVRLRAAKQTPDPSVRRLGAVGVACTALVGLTLFTMDSGKSPPESESSPDTTSAANALRAKPKPDAGMSVASVKEKTRRVSLAGRGEIVLETGAVARLPSGVESRASGPVQLALDSGELTASVGPRGADEPLSIVTPQVAVVVIGTRFSVHVADGVTTVKVAHGRVRVDRAGQSLFVDGGDALRSDDPRFVPEDEPSSTTGNVAECEGVRQRRRCLRRIARGTDLSAENALFSLALLEHDERKEHEAALVHLRNYERRFPRGRLRQEVALTIVRIHRELGRPSDACALAEAYSQEFGSASSVHGKLHDGCGAVSGERSGRR